MGTQQETVPDQFTGYAAFSAEKWSDLSLHKYTPKPLDPWDVDIKITYCGVCGSDLHVLRSGWSPTHYPVVPGHEIIGHVVRAGAKSHLKPGDLVGVGAQAWSCGHCQACSGCSHSSENPSAPHPGPEGEHGHGGPEGLAGGKENYCPRVCETYNWQLPDGSMAYGGYADYCRIHENFVYPIPAELEARAEEIAPMLCGGVTMYSPLKRAGVKAGTKVGIVGLGGLGHFGVLFAKALGAEVVVISHSPRKEQDAKDLGASGFIHSGDPEGWKKYHRTLDLIISTNFSTEQPMKEYLGLLAIGGTLVVCGIPEGRLPQLEWADIAAANLAIRGSNVGSKKEVIEMLQLVKEQDVRSWVQVRKMSEVSDVVREMDKGMARYRYVLKAEF